MPTPNVTPLAPQRAEHERAARWLAVLEEEAAKRGLPSQDA